MKRLTYIFLVLSILVSGTFLSAKTPKKQMIGMWKVTKSYDMKTGKIFKPEKDVYYQFQSNGSLIMIDTNLRERKAWKWNLNEGVLNMKATDGSWKLSGPVRFKSKEQFVLLVRFSSEKVFLWSFNKM